jgi:pentatricopeptide repeat protein
MHRAGKYLFDLLPELGLQPTIISFTSLIGALRTGQLQDILSAYKDMKTEGIEPDQVFAETYLVSVLQLEKSQQVLQARAPQQLQELLRERPVERLKAARQAIADFRKGKMKLSGLCFNIGEALKQLRS